MRFHYLSPTGELKQIKRRKRDWPLIAGCVGAAVVGALACIGAVAVVFWIAGIAI